MSGYGYVVSRLRAMETRLVDDGTYQRILDSEDLESALKVLGETSYSAYLGEMKSPGEFDSVIENELINAYNELSLFVPDAGLVELCRIPYDFHNVKVIFKNMVQVKEGAERSYRLMSKLGSYPPDNYILAIEGEDYMLLPHGLDSAIPKCYSLWEETRSIREVELLLDRCLFEIMREKAGKLNMPEVVKWVRAKIDAENLRTLCRLKRTGTEAGDAMRFLHKGGHVSPERFAQILGEPIEGWSRFLSATDLGKVFSALQETTDVESMIIDIECALDEFSIKILDHAKYNAFSPANVLLYLSEKELEAKNLRIVLVAVANGTDKDLARRLLRHAK